MIALLLAAQVQAADPQEQVAQLEKLLAQVEAAHPTETVVVQTAEYKTECEAGMMWAVVRHIALDVEPVPMPVSSLEGCVHLAEVNEVDLDDMNAVIGFLRPLFPEPMGKLTDGVWRDLLVYTRDDIRAAAVTDSGVHVEIPFVGPAPTPLVAAPPEEPKETPQETSPPGIEATSDDQHEEDRDPKEMLNIAPMP